MGPATVCEGRLVPVPGAGTGSSVGGLRRSLPAKPNLQGVSERGRDLVHEERHEVGLLGTHAKHGVSPDQPLAAVAKRLDLPLAFSPPPLYRLSVRASR